MVVGAAFPELERLQQACDQAGVRLLSGFDGGMDMAVVETEMRTLLRDRTEASAQSPRARAIVDGRGLERAAQAVETLLNGVKQ